MSTAELSTALQAINDASEHFDESQLLVAAKCRGLMVGYHNRWKDAGYRALFVEQTRQADLFNPDSQRKSRTFQVAGKLDVIAELNGRRVLIDHKTTSEDITDPNAAYWRQLAVEGQVNHYMLLDWLHGEKFDHAVWDVVRKPAIRPKKLTKAERASIVSTGKYFGYSVSGVNRNRLQTEESEDLELYQARLASDCIERTDWYFQRRPVPRLDSEILEYAKELWEHSQEILHVRQTNRHARNSGACLLYGSPCEYLGICSGHDTPESDKWKRTENVHEELEGTSGDLLTNSRIRCFQTCRRRHFYRYEIGLRRQDDEEREALYFGRLWHVAQEAWWNCFLKENANGDCPRSLPVNAIGGSTSCSAETQLAERD